MNFTTVKEVFLPLEGPEPQYCMTPLHAGPSNGVLKKHALLNKWSHNWLTTVIRNDLVGQRQFFSFKIMFLRVTVFLDLLMHTDFSNIFYDFV